jgi:hypothetical protein
VFDPVTVSIELAAPEITPDKVPEAVVTSTMAPVLDRKITFDAVTATLNANVVPTDIVNEPVPKPEADPIAMVPALRVVPPA